MVSTTVFKIVSISSNLITSALFNFLNDFIKIVFDKSYL